MYVGAIANAIHIVEFVFLYMLKPKFCGDLEIVKILYARLCVMLCKVTCYVMI